jgi:DNA mismatch repair protein MutL
MPIRVLDPRVAAQIAAGEVVERPASIVKELIENALDAGATRVSVSARGGGIDELVIQDDGGGIPAGEIELAFERHATSKLTSADDLWAIGTLGFRGEALPSIAAIAQVSCASRVPTADMGAELRIAGGEVQSVAPRGGPPGTTFTIRNLFYNIPVRRSFLRSPALEAAAIAAVVSQYALAYPKVAFTLVRDGKRVLQTSGRGELSEVVLELYGVEVARQMIPIDGRAGEDIGAVRVRGLVSAPTVSRGGRDGMHITVNGRAIAPRGPISAMIEQGYHTLLMKGRFPIVVLQIQVHPAAVDVNVHPTKSEVKFRQPELVAQTVERAVRAAVQSAVVIQGWEPAEAPAEPALAAPAPPAPVPAAAPLDDEIWSGDEVIEPARAQSAPLDNRPAAGNHLPPAPAQPMPATSLEQDDEPEPIDDYLDEPPAPAAPTPVQAALIGDVPQYREPGERQPPARLAEAPAPERSEWAARPREARAEPAWTPSAPARPTPSAPRPPESRPAEAAPRLPQLRALAQLAQTYLLTEGPEGALYLIDQHAAHERITYERLLAQHAAGALQAQTLLLPQHVALPPQARQVLLGATEELASWGFALAEADGGVDVLTVPPGLALEMLSPTLVDLASHIGGAGGQTPADRRDALLATLACHTSVRAGQTLTPIEQQALIDQLGGCAGPRTCPHGRPTLIVVTRHQLEQQFGRLGA